MGALQETWTAVRPYLGWILLVLGIVLVVVLVLTAKKWRPWLQKKLKRGSAASGDQGLSRGRLRQVYRRFLAALPWRYRSAVTDFPNVVVLGHAGSGKSRLIGLEVDWERQKRQFMPSYEEDPLVKIYLGPDVVVQKVASTLLSDISAEAEEALRALWKESIGRRKPALAVIVLDVRWLRERHPDEIREFTHELRGKLNLISDVHKAPVEARICLTHMDTLSGFADFARLLRQHGFSLDMEVPPRGEEARLKEYLKLLEEHLALGLTSLPVDAFDRLEEFYSGLSEAFEALIRFVSGLREGGALSFPPELTRVYLSTLSPETRATGVLYIQPEKKAHELRTRNRLIHLRRCALILAVGCLPVLAAYANFSRLLDNAWKRVDQFDETARWLNEHGLKARGGVIDTEASAVMEAMGRLWASTRFWPPLKDSFKDDQEELRDRVSDIIRAAYIQPLFEGCMEQCATCDNQIPGCSARAVCTGGLPRESRLYRYEEHCRPEQMLYLQAILYSSSKDPLGKFIRQSLDSHHLGKWDWASEAFDLEHLEGDGGEKHNWLDEIDLQEAVAGIYVLNSDRSWRASEAELRKWAGWPYEGLTFDGQIAPWWKHLEALKLWLGQEALDLEAWSRLQQERGELQELLDSSAYYEAGPRILDLLNASQTSVNAKTLEGIESTLLALQWMRENRKTLQGVLDLEAQADQSLHAGLQMSAAQLLTKANGLFEPKAGDVVFEVQAPGKDTFELSPMAASEQLLDKLVTRVKKSKKLAFGQAAGTSGDGAEGQESAVEEEDGLAVGGAQEPSGPLVSRLVFETDIKPLVEEFTQRLAESKLTPEQAAAREAFVLEKMTEFARIYRASLFGQFRGYQFEANRSNLVSELGALAQPSSKLVGMLRDVANLANLGPLESRFYEPLRQAIAPFQPIVQLMTPDKDGKTAALDQYRLLVAQLHGELTGARPAGSNETAAKPKEDKAEKGASPEAEEPVAQLAELLSPRGRVALAMLLEQEDSYLRKVDAWLDEQGILGEFRRPFRQPFLLTRKFGQEEIERFLRDQWTAEYKRTLAPLLSRYPFKQDAQREIDPAELEVIRRKDGEFWHFVERVLSTVLIERGSNWSLRRPLRGRLALPRRMLSTLGQMSRLSRALWDEEGKPVPLTVQVRPLPLPRSPAQGDFVTMSYFRCGGASAFGFNQSPTWQDFPLSWWDQQTSSLGVELRSPKSEGKRYRTVEMTRSSWSCFRLLDLGSFTEEQNMMWALPAPEGDASGQVLEVSFGMRGKPWALFRREKT